MGERGPVPKRSNQRRRVNKDSEPQTAPAGEAPSVPEPIESWHPIAKGWYESLAVSGQSAFYEASDWATAVLVAESISRELKPQVVGVMEETGEPVFAVVPMKGAALSAYLKAMSSLLVTEGDRRRAQLELQRGGEKPDSSADVPNIDDYRSRLAG
jgi:hypothetical protein